MTPMLFVHLLFIFLPAAPRFEMKPNNFHSIGHDPEMKQYAGAPSSKKIYFKANLKSTRKNSTSPFWKYGLSVFICMPVNFTSAFEVIIHSHLIASRISKRPAHDVHLLLFVGFVHTRTDDYATLRFRIAVLFVLNFNKLLAGNYKNI